MNKIFSALILLCAANVFAQNSRPVASTISAKALSNKNIEITWSYPKKTTPKIIATKLYRASKPFTSYKEIVSLEPIQTTNTTSYMDTAEKGGEYFYAVIAVTTAGDYRTIIPGMNATTVGARAKIPETTNKKEPQKKSGNGSKAIERPAQTGSGTNTKPSTSGTQKPSTSNTQKPSTPATSGKKKPSTTTTPSTKNPPLRKTPLPFPGSLLGLEHERATISNQAMDSVKDLGKPQESEPVEFKVPYFFEDDMFAPDGGDEYTLFETLRAGLVQRKYKESVGLFNDFLSVNRTKSVAARAQFYLGESYYFCKDYESAIHCFLVVRNEFPELTQQWIDSSLDLLRFSN